MSECCPTCGAPWSVSDQEFEQAWKAYPRRPRAGKQAAQKAWKKQKPSLSDVMAALEWQSKQRDWVKDGGQFIPHMSTWLNGRRWEDEAPVVPKQVELGSWRDECQAMHNGSCGNQHFHAARKAHDLMGR